MTSNLQFTINLAKRAGRLALKKMDKIQKITIKTHKRDIATDIDVEVEELIVKAIRKKFTSHNIIREEGQDIDQCSEYTWIIDPIDGTKYFAAGIKNFAVSIGLWREDQPVLGVVYQPGTNDLWWAKNKQGAFYNGKKIRVSMVTHMDDAIISLGGGGFANKTIEQRKEALKFLNNVAPACHRLRAMGASSLCLCYLAQGYLEAHVCLPGQAKIWDVAAGVAIAKEAGAKITNQKGQWPGLNSDYVFATNGRLHNPLLKFLK